MGQPDRRVVRVDPVSHPGRPAVGFVGGRRDAERGEQVVVADEERGRPGAEQTDDLAEDGLGHLAGRAPARRDSRDSRLRAAVSCSRASARASRSRMRPVCTPIDDSHRQESHERQPVLGVVHGQGVVGRQEEEVPGEEGQHRRQDCRPGAAGAGHEHDEQQVQQRPLTFGEVAAPGQEQRGRKSNGQDGQDVSVAGQPG